MIGGDRSYLALTLESMFITVSSLWQLALFRCLRVIQLLQDNESLASETVALCHQSIEQVCSIWFDLVLFVVNPVICKPQGVEPVRKAAVATLVWMCRYGPRGSVRKMAEELLFLIPHSSLWTIRCLALHSIGCSLWMFSRSFVKAKFLPLLADIMKVLARSCLRVYTYLSSLGCCDWPSGPGVPCP